MIIDRRCMVAYSKIRLGHMDPLLQGRVGDSSFFVILSNVQCPKRRIGQGVGLNINREESMKPVGMRAMLPPCPAWYGCYAAHRDLRNAVPNRIRCSHGACSKVADQGALRRHQVLEENVLVLGMDLILQEKLLKNRVPSSFHTAGRRV